MYLSAETLKKNKINHPEITLEEYIKLSWIVSEAKIIIEKEGQFLVFIKQDGKYYFSVVKTTKDRNELYITSFRYTNLNDIKSEMKKGKVIRNEL